MKFIRAGFTMLLIPAFAGYAALFGLLFGALTGALVATPFVLPVAPPSEAGDVILGFAIVGAAMSGLLGPLVFGLRFLRLGMWTRTAPLPGIPAAPDAFPRLWRTVRELAGHAGTRPPEEIRLVVEPSVAILENTRLLGLRRGHRVLFIGVPIAVGLSPQELRAAIAHEYGHVTGGATWLSGVAYLGRATFFRTLAVASRTLLGRVYLWYGAFYLLMTRSFGRAQELAADQVAARLTSPEAYASALWNYHVLAKIWDDFYDHERTKITSPDGMPCHLADGFGRYLAAEAETVVALRAHPPVPEPSPWDTHPPLSVRIAALGVSAEAMSTAGMPTAGVGTPGAPSAAERTEAACDGVEVIDAVVDEFFQRSPGATSWRV